MDMRINLVFEDTVWSTSVDGLDFKYPTIILTQAGAVACLPMDSDSGEQADVDTSKTSESQDSDPVLAVLVKRCWGGHPLRPLNVMDSQESTTSTSTASETETDVDTLMTSTQDLSKP